MVIMSQLVFYKGFCSGYMLKSKEIVINFVIILLSSFIQVFGKILLMLTLVGKVQVMVYI